MKRKILIVAGEQPLATLLQDQLSERGLEADWEPLATAALTSFHPRDTAVVVLLSTRTDMDAPEFVRRIKHASHGGVHVVLWTGADVRSLGFIDTYVQAGVSRIFRQAQGDVMDIIATIQELAHEAHPA